LPRFPVVVVLGLGRRIGDFWLVYHLNFDSQRRIVAVPFQRHSGHFESAQPFARSGAPLGNRRPRCGRAAAAR